MCIRDRATPCGWPWEGESCARGSLWCPEDPGYAVEAAPSATSPRQPIAVVTGRGDMATPTHLLSAMPRARARKSSSTRPVRRPYSAKAASTPARGMSVWTNPRSTAGSHMAIWPQSTMPPDAPSWLRTLAPWKSACDQTHSVCSRADFHGANVLSHDGAFGGIVDWGSMAMCDPAVDLGFVHTLMPRAGVDAAFAEYGRLTGRVDDDFRARARGIALSKCVGVAMSPRPVTTAMGWRGLVALG